jgi:hypothetical protein
MSVKVTDVTHRSLRGMRFRREMSRKGYERLAENGSPLWELHRGFRTDHKIVDAVVAPCGKEIWIKIEKAA